MTDCRHFSALTGRLEGLLRSHPDIELRLLPEGQLLLQKDMIPNPAAAGLKAAAQTPSPEGYEIYVSCQGGDGEGEPPAARIEPPAVVAAPGTVLALEDGRQEGYWRFLNAATGERVTVRAQVGPQAPRSEVNDLLTAIGAELLR